ncbi:hypothetical protein GCM10022239_03450 [Leifsonia bigeumensis]|uniref:Minor capsid protein n=1 Tax=Leifsonella bigeumensis TaxID=433643 RepID=A0ABP7F5U7_9MICO
MAVFVPDPEAFDLEEFIEQLSDELALRYRDAEDELIRELATRVYRDLELREMLPTEPVRGGLTAAERREQNRILGQLAVHRAQAVRELQGMAVAIVERLRRSGMAEEIIKVAAEEGEAAAAARLGLAKRLPTVFQTGSAATAVSALAISLQSRLEVMNQRITRYPQDAYQRIVSLTAPNTLLGVTTSLRQQQATVQRFLREGITGFVDKSGRNWRIGSYAEMAGRTAVNRAFNDAGIWRMEQSGIHLVTIVGGFDACKRCAPWIGKTLSTDGTPAGPRIMQHSTQDQTVTVYVAGTIEQARNAGWNHPNCRCRPVAMLPGLAAPQQDFEYNQQADEDRQKQRELERDIRSAKRDLDIAPDAVSRKRAERDLREARAARREFTSRTGRRVQSHREQLHFADGR